MFLSPSACNWTRKDAGQERWHGAHATGWTRNAPVRRSETTRRPAPWPQMGSTFTPQADRGIVTRCVAGHFGLFISNFVFRRKVTALGKRRSVIESTAIVTISSSLLAERQPPHEEEAGKER